MKMNQQKLNLQYGKKKGFIFTYDALIAVFVLVIILLAATFYASSATEDKLSNVHTANIGSDTINILIAQKTLETLDENAIQNELYTLLPNNYDITLQITTNTGLIIDIKNNIPNGIFIASGKKYFATKENIIAKVEYKTWQKA